MSLLEYKSGRFEEWQKRRSTEKPTPEQNSLIRGVRARLERKQDARNQIIGGENGVGKSALDLRLAEILNPKLYMQDIPRAVEDRRLLHRKAVLDRRPPARGEIVFGL